MTEKTDGRSFRSVFHPSDNSTHSQAAFAHALKFALADKAHLAILHADASGLDPQTWWRAPAIRNTLQAWGLLEEGSPRKAIFSELGVPVTRVKLESREPINVIIDYLQKFPAELMVLGTEGRDGLPRWLRKSVAESAARESKTNTLFVPKNARGFVAAKDGHVTLHRVLVPIDHDPDPQHSLEVTARLLRTLRIVPRSIKLLYVGSGKQAPKVDTEAVEPAWPWEHLHCKGEVVGEILNTADAFGANLLVMATKGHQGFLDVLRGSTTEQVLRRAPCPVLAVPAA
jgi:nucleotide-binding universal stress UspA family protein